MKHSKGKRVRVPSDMHEHLDSILLSQMAIPVWLDRSQRLVHIRKRRNRTIAKLPRKLKKRITRNLAKSNKTYASMCVSLYISEYNRITMGWNTCRDSSRQIKGIRFQGDTDDWCFVDHVVPDNVPTSLQDHT